jgi:hypothetical protein
MLTKHAIQITGGLGKPSKMPGRAYGLPAGKCAVGSKLRAVPGSVCSMCYAHKGRYAFGGVQAAQYRRLKSINHPQWVEAMVTLISGQSGGWFRWHDSGDIQSIDHLRRIIAVCRHTPDVRHWLPTREVGILRAYLRDGGRIPANLTIRLSAAMVGTLPLRIDRRIKGSTVHAKGTEPPRGAVACSAPTTGGHCADCRACWDRTVPVVSYGAH